MSFERVKHVLRPRAALRGCGWPQRCRYVPEARLEGAASRDNTAGRRQMLMYTILNPFEMILQSPIIIMQVCKYCVDYLIAHLCMHKSAFNATIVRVSRSHEP